MNEELFRGLWEQVDVDEQLSEETVRCAHRQLDAYTFRGLDAWIHLSSRRVHDLTFTRSMFPPVEVMADMSLEAQGGLLRILDAIASSLSRRYSIHEGGLFLCQEEGLFS